MRIQQTAYSSGDLALPAAVACLPRSPVLGAEPSFRVPEVNVTVVEGETAILPCSIQFLGKYKVVWTDDAGFLLSLNDRRIIDNPRISVERPFTKDWNLMIRKVEYSDRGSYICQISTTPVKDKHVLLIVLVPPKIIEEYSSADMTVREEDTVTLVCNATGVPPPNVRWFRLGTLPTFQKEEIGTPGEVLIIHKVSRDCGGVYECSADNTILPAQRRQMRIEVQYPPEVYLPETRLGQYPGKETFLQCEITANPHGIMTWMFDGLDLSLDKSPKYFVEMYNTDNAEKKILSVRIKNITVGDYGRYLCTAKNFLGQDKDGMYLYDYSTRLVSTTTPSSTSRYIDDVSYIGRTSSSKSTDNKHRYDEPRIIEDNASAAKSRSSGSTWVRYSIAHTIVSVILLLS